MPIPDYQSFMLPLLRPASNGEEHTVKAAVTELSDHFDLSDTETVMLLVRDRDTQIGRALENC